MIRFQPPMSRLELIIFAMFVVEAAIVGVLLFLIYGA
jgi:hypothetical protein